MGAEEGKIESIPAQAWESVRGGLRVFSVYFWHSEGWSPRNEALFEAFVRQANTTRHPWLIACDANMCPEDFFKKRSREEEEAEEKERDTGQEGNCSRSGCGHREKRQGRR